MAQKMISPGVFVNEIDQSQLPQAVESLGAAFIGPTIKGRAMVPVTVNSYTGFVRAFGGTNPDLYLPYGVKEYFGGGAQTATIIRTLHDDGYKLQDPNIIIASGSFGKKVLGVVHPSQVLNENDDYYDGSESLFEHSTITTNSNGNFVLSVSGSYQVNTSDFPNAKGNGTAVYSMSVSPSSPNYFTKVLPVQAKTTAEPGYLYVANTQVAKLAAEDANVSFSIKSGSLSFLGKYSNASTPWIISQNVGNTNYNLFKVHTLSDGVHANYEVKIGISDIRPAGSVAGSEYGSFTLTVRAVDTTTIKAYGTPYEASDSDSRPNILEIFTNLNLDPNSPNYISRIIGDQYFNLVEGNLISTGDYANNSNYIRIEVDDNVAKGVISPELVPFGFQSPYLPLPSVLASEQITVIPALAATAASASIVFNTASVFGNELSSLTGDSQFDATYVGVILNGTRRDVIALSDQSFLNQIRNDYLESSNYTSDLIFFNTSSYATRVTSLRDGINNSPYINTFVSASVVSGSGAVPNLILTSKILGAAINDPENLVDLMYRSINFYGGADAQEGSVFGGGEMYPTASYVTSQTIANTYNKKVYLGYDYDFSNTNNLGYLKPVPSSDITTGSNAKFVLSNCNQHVGANFPSAASPYTGSIDLSSNTSIDSRKFIVPFQGGSDGIQPNRRILSSVNIVAGNVSGYDLSSTSAKDYSVYRDAIDILSDKDTIDINLLSMPGVNYQQHPAVLDYATTMCEERGDVFLIYDAASPTANVSTVANLFTGVDTNYAATYSPWFKANDPESNRMVLLPATIGALEAIAASDSLGDQFYAPAGLNRGGISSAIDLYFNYKQADRDVLYDARVNPLAKFPGQGVSVWGQKTLQRTPSALDRINVRRLLIQAKKFISASSKFLVFEGSTTETVLRFTNTVNPYLEGLKERRGVFDFRVIMDDPSEQELIDRNILYGKIRIKPTRTAEYIMIDFTVEPTGAVFDEV